MTTLERVPISSVTPEGFNRAFRSGAGRPVVITGMLDDLPECRLDVLCDLLPDRKLPARHYGKGHFAKPKSEWKTYAGVMQVTPREYARLLGERVAHEESVYLAQVAIGDSGLDRRMQAVLAELGARCDLTPAVDINLWLGPGGHTEPLHYDSGDGTLIQLHGAKRVVLFPPSQTRNLYPFSLRARGVAPWVSRVYVDRPDFDAFPRLRQALAHQVEVILGPREVLFIPANWWHEVTALGDDYVCSVNRFWKVTPLWRLFTNRLSPIVYALSMAALAVAKRRRARARVGQDEAAKRGAA